MNFSIEDFISMRWNIFPLSTAKSVMRIFPEIRNIFIDVITEAHERGDKPEYKTITDDQIIRYIIYCYHRKSPLVKQIENIVDRKIEAMTLAGIRPKKDGQFTQEVDDILTREDRFVVTMTLRFLKFENSLDFATISIVTESLFRLLEEVSRNDITSDSLAKGLKDITDIGKQIEVIRQRMFNDEKELSNFVPSFNVLEEKVYKIVPEQFATDNSKIS